jgi:hypothetical protein
MKKNALLKTMLVNFKCDCTAPITSRTSETSSSRNPYSVSHNV